VTITLLPLRVLRSGTIVESTGPMFWYGIGILVFYLHKWCKVVDSLLHGHGGLQSMLMRGSVIYLTDCRLRHKVQPVPTGAIISMPRPTSRWLARYEERLVRTLVG
jgi:hypothetical protein